MRDHRIETFLDRQRVPFHFVADVPLSRIDVQASLANQARLGEKLDEGYVERYTLMMIDGVDLGALIGYETKGRIVLVDGNHRVAAAIHAEQQHLSIYLLDTTDAAVLTRITHLANINLDGKGITPLQALEHAKYLHRSCGYTIPDAAREVGMKEGTVAHGLALDKARILLLEVGERPEAFTESSSRRLASIANRPVRVCAAALTRSARLIDSEVNELVTRVNATGDQEAGLALVNQWETRPDLAERIAQTGRRATRSGATVRPKPKPCLRLFGLFAEAIALLEHYPTLSALQCTGPIEQARLREQREQLNKLLSKAATSVVLA